MERDKVFEKQKADRAAANANASSNVNGRKDEPWLTENIIVKVLTCLMCLALSASTVLVLLFREASHDMVWQ